MTSLFKRNWSTVLLKYNAIGMNFSFIYNIHTIIWCLPSLIKLLVYSPKCPEWMCFSLLHTVKQYFSCWDIVTFLRNQFKLPSARINKTHVPFLYIVFLKFCSTTFWLIMWQNVSISLNLETWILRMHWFQC